MAGVKLGSMEIVLGLDLKNFERQMKGIRRKFGRLSGQLKMAGRDLTQALTLPLAAIGVGATKLAVDWETSFANVQKTVKGTESELSQLSDGLRKMSTELPITAGGLASIAEEAGRLGIKQREILGFTETIVRLAETSTLGAEEAATGLARFANITRLPQAQIGRLATSLTVLGSEFATTESEIQEMSLRLAAAGTHIGLSAAEITGFSAALTSLGINAEAGGTAISRVFIDMAAAVDQGGAKLELFASVAGQSVDGFKKRFETDAAGAVSTFISGLGTLEKRGKSLTGTIGQLGFANVRIRDALLRASGAGDLLERTLDRSNTAWAENTALVELSDKRFKTTAAMLTVLKNKFTELGRQLGEALIPALKALMEVFQGFLPTIQGWINSFSALPASTKATIIAFTALAAAIGPLLIMLGMLSGSLAAVASMMTLVSAHPIVALITAISALVVGIIGYNVVAAKMKAFTSGIGTEATDTEKRIRALQKTIENITKLEKLRAQEAQARSNKTTSVLRQGGAAIAVVNAERKKEIQELIKAIDGQTTAEAKQAIQVLEVIQMVKKSMDAQDRLTKAKTLASQKAELLNALLAEESALQMELATKSGPAAAQALDDSQVRMSNLNIVLSQLTAGQIDASDAGQKLLDILEEHRKKAGQTKTAWEEWEKSIGDVMKNASAWVDDFTFNVMQRFTDGIGDAFAQAIVSGKSFGDLMSSLWKDIAKMIISRLVSIAAQFVIFSLIQKATGKAGAVGMISSKAAETYAGGFASVMTALPFPLNIVMAPIVGASQAALMTATALGLASFAQGGIISSPQLVLAGEAGPEAIVPLDRLGSFGGGGQVINLHIDGELITQEVVHGMPAFIDARLGGI